MNIIALCLEDKGCLAVPFGNKNAEDIMTSPVITANEETPVSDIVNLFAEKKLTECPSSIKGKKLIGIVSREDALQTIISRTKG